MLLLAPHATCASPGHTRASPCLQLLVKTLLSHTHSTVPLISEGLPLRSSSCTRIRLVPFLRPKADLDPDSKTFRPETGQQRSLGRAGSCHLCPKNISVRSQCPAPASAASATPLWLPLLMLLPSKWVSCGQAHTRSPLPCSLPGSLPQVCWGEARQEAQASTVLDNSSSWEKRSQLEPGRRGQSAPAGEAGSTNCDSKPFLAQTPVLGRVGCPYALSRKYLLQNLGRSKERCAQRLQALHVSAKKATLALGLS